MHKKYPKRYENTLLFYEQSQNTRKTLTKDFIFNVRNFAFFDSNVLKLFPTRNFQKIDAMDFSHFAEHFGE